MIVMNQAGHFMYREYPEEFNQDLITFNDFLGENIFTLGI
jgi:pimeloyl-ACP methyl ester carboxylesterase